MKNFRLFPVVPLIVCAILSLTAYRSLASVFDFSGPSSPARDAEAQQSGTTAQSQTETEKEPEAKPSFTIEKIEPQAKGKKVRLYFTDRVAYGNLEEKLKIFPPVRIHWWKTESSSSGHVVTLDGEFRPGQTYRISLPENYMSVNYKHYKKGVFEFTVPNLPSEITLRESGTVIERDGRQLLDLEVMNVDETVFTGLQLPAVLLPVALEQARSGRARPWEDVKSVLEEKLTQVKAAAAGDPDFSPLLKGITEDRNVFFTTSGLNDSHPFSMPLSFRSGKEKGTIELVRVDSRRKEQPAKSVNQVLCITDTGISYKISGKSLLVWTTSLRTGKVIPGASVILFTRHNVALFAGRTNDNGLLSISDGSWLKALPLTGTDSGMSRKQLELINVAFMAASTADDSSFIELNSTGNINPSDVAQSKSVTQDELLRKGVVFTERGIYSPGDRVHFKGTVRQYRESAITPPEGLPCRFTITDPKDQQVFDNTIQLSEFGTASDSFKSEKYMPLGTYTLKMAFGAAEDRKEFTTTFQVQEFRPPRHFTKIGFKRTSKEVGGLVNMTKVNEFLVCSVDGRYYAGGPVKNGRVRWTARKAETSYDRAEYPDYTFGYSEGTSNEILESGESVLDSSGRLEVLIPINDDVVSGMQAVQFEATVVDFDGRAASDSSVYQLESDMIVGISSHSGWVKSEDPVSLHGIVIDKSGNKVESGALQVRVMQKSVSFFPKRNAEGRVYWERQEIWRDRLGAEVPIEGGEAIFDFDFTWGGNYLIVFSYKAKDGRRYSSGTMFSVDYDYYYGYNQDNKTLTPAERLNLIPDRPAYSPGETARVYFNRRRPFDTALVTVERSGIMQSWVVAVSPDQRYIDVPITDGYFPNVYISVLGTTPRSDLPIYREEFDAGAPGFLFGTVNLDVKRETGELTVAINGDQKKMRSLPGAEVSVNLRCTDAEGNGVASEMAVCVVDRSVLALTGFRTPRLDSLNSFRGPLSVFTGDIRKELMRQTLFDMLKVDPLTGGGGAEASSLSKKMRTDFNPVPYFNPSVRTDEDGNATVTFKFPDTMTEYSIYAVACDKGSRFGSSERSAVVVKDFYMEPGIPRFFTKGDRFRFNVSAFNKTEAGGELSFGVEADDRVAISAEGSSFNIGPMDNVFAGITGRALKPGISTFTFSGRFGELEDTVRLSLPVNTGYIIEKDAVFGNFRGEASVTYRFPQGTTNIPEDEMNPEETQAVLTVSGSPFIKLVPALKYMLRYPYGCIEQTSSGVLALSGLRGLIIQGLIPGFTVENTDKFLQAGIDRLISMQVDSGGFAYWPGQSEPHRWGSVYATYAMTLNKQAGLDVPKERLSKALDYLLQTAKGEASGDIRFRAYAAYLLALNGRPDPDLLKKVSAYPGDEKYGEAAAVALLAMKASSGLTEELQSLGRPVLERGWNNGYEYHRWWDFYAPYRANAVRLLAASEVLPGEISADNAAKSLLAGMQKGIWTSTSDTGWSLIALGAYFRGAGFGEGKVSGKIMQGGKTVAEFSMRPAESFTVPIDFPSFLRDPSVDISADTQSSLLYSLSLTYPRTDYAASGYSNGFEVYKEIKNLDGSDTIRVGDVVEVKVRFTARNYDNEYLVMDDPLPAGLVAINSALKTEEHIARSVSDTDDDDDYYWWSYWDEDGFYKLIPNFMEMRDDRVLVFRDHLWRGTFQYTYYARAVCEGDFIIPPTKVQLMYKPERVGYTPAGRFRVEGNR